MKTDNTASAKISKNQQIALGLCGAILLVVMLYQFFWNSSTTPVVNVSANDPKYSNRVPNSSLKDQPQTPDAVNQVKQVVDKQLDNGFGSELAFDDLVRGKGEADVNRNLFAYPPPPPPPVEPPPPPPTLPISRLNPTQVYAQTKAFEVTVVGQGFTEQDRIYLNGNGNFAPTKFISEREVRATIPQQYFTAATQLRIEVKRPGAEKDFYSNTLNISVMQPPPPRFTMLGQYNDGGGQNAHAVLTEGEKRSVAKIGDTVGNTFKVVAVGPNYVEVEDTTVAIGVRHQVKMKEENSTGGGGAFVNQQFQQAYTTQPQPQQSSYTPEMEEAQQPPQVQQANDNVRQAAELTADQQKQQADMQKQREEMIRRRQELIQQRLNQQGINGPLQRR